MGTATLGSRRVGKLSRGLCRNGVWPSRGDIADGRGLVKKSLRLRKVILMSSVCSLTETMLSVLYNGEANAKASRWKPCPRSGTNRDRAGTCGSLHHGQCFFMLTDPETPWENVCSHCGTYRPSRQFGELVSVGDPWPQWRHFL